MRASVVCFPIIKDCHPERKSFREGPAFVPAAEAGSGSNENAHTQRFRVGLDCFASSRLWALLGILILCSLGSSVQVSAQNITGTVTNGTTGKPSPGDAVSLLALSQGMQEVASTKSDAQGKFSFPAPSDGGNAPHMVRVTHQGVSYFPQGGPLMPGATTTAVTVYDTAKTVGPLTQTVEVDRYQSEDGKRLQVIALFALQNASNPPRTLEADRTFTFVLPAGAEIESSYAKAPNGQPVASPAAETDQKNTYAFSFPLKPGETQFQVQYHMPYSGEASLSPKPLSNVQHFVVMTPQGMTFAAKDQNRFQAMPDQQGVMVATGVTAGDDLSFRISGKGVFQAEGQQPSPGDNSGGAMGGGQPAANDNRPGGGLGAPIDAPDPLHDYRAVILGAFAVVLVMGGAYVVSKSNQRPQTAVPSGPPIDAPIGQAPARDRSTLLLEAMKEELFQLEIDRQQGKISAEEYTRAKAALDETIRRALARGERS